MVFIASNSPVLFYKGNRIDRSKCRENASQHSKKAFLFLLIQTVQKSEVLVKQVCFIESPNQHDDAVD